MRVVRLFACIALLTVAVAVTTAAQTPGHPTRTEGVTGEPRGLRQSELHRFEAMMQGDTTALRRYLADDLTYIHSNARLETKADHLKAIGSKEIVYQAIGPVEFRYRAYGDLAVGSGTVKSRGTQAGTPFDIVIRATTVHVRRGGRWLLLSWQSTRMP